MNVSEAIRLKRAVREFREEELPEEAVRAILNAGRRAQSSKNAQPCRFVAIRDREILRNLSKCGQFAGHLAGAALGIAIATPDPALRFQILFDAGQAAAYMQLAAWELGIGSCMATIYDTDQARAVLDLPTEMRVQFAISFGYPRDAARLSAPPKAGGRQAFEEIVHWEKW